MKPQNGVAIAAMAVAALVAGADEPKFEVASVKKAAPGGATKSAGVRSVPSGAPPAFAGGRFSYTAPLYDLVLHAYAIQACRLRTDCAFISGGPDWNKAWIRDDRFEIQATTPAGTPDYTQVQFLNGQATQIQLMLQSLLADRFQLKLHHEKKELPIYALTVIKNGPKAALKTSAGMVQAPNGTKVRAGVLFQPPDSNTGIQQVTMRNQSMADLVKTLTMVTDRPVLDRTELTGAYDFDISYIPESSSRDSPSLPSPLMGAFQDQLGLKLESIKAPVDVLVIDHVERPSDN
jgi:uncharacterized protein (TIGR03435 family)